MTNLFPTELQFIRAQGANTELPDEVLVALYPEFIIDSRFRQSATTFKPLAGSPPSQELAILLEYVSRRAKTEDEFFRILNEAGAVFANSLAFSSHPLALFLSEDPEYKRFFNAFGRREDAGTFVSLLNGCMTIVESLVCLADYTPIKDQRIIRINLLLRGAFVALSLPLLLGDNLPYDEKRLQAKVSVEESAVQFVENLKATLLRDPSAMVVRK